MLVIRHAQIHALAREVFDRFLLRALDHVQQHFPAVAAAVPAPELEAGLRHALDRAAHHGLQAERELFSYINLACVFGRDFDTDPALPWAARILGDGTPAPVRMAGLITAGLRHERAGRGWLARPEAGP